MNRARLLLCVIMLGCFAVATAKADPPRRLKVTAIVTAYYHNSHADVIASRLMQTMNLDGQGSTLPMDLVSLYVDQRKGSDKGLGIAREHKVPVFATVAEALTLGGDKLAVDGVLLIAEHGAYPRSATGQIIYPKRRLFGEVLKVFDRSGRVVPVFNDKHLADNWEDANWMYESARERRIPLMAGSSLPTLWRYPPANLTADARVEELVGTSYASLDAYGFHGLEVVQCLAERRAGGETGIRSVQSLKGDSIWEAGRKGDFSRELLDAAVKRRQHTPFGPGETLENTLQDPVLFRLNYRDGLRISVLCCFNRIDEWTAAWSEGKSAEVTSTLFRTQEARPFAHFGILLTDIEKFIRTGKSPRPVERTLLVSGALDALLMSLRDGGRMVETPYLNISYRTGEEWRQPAPPPPDRPVNSQ